MALSEEETQQRKELEFQTRWNCNLLQKLTGVPWHYDGPLRGQYESDVMYSQHASEAMINLQKITLKDVKASTPRTTPKAALFFKVAKQNEISTHIDIEKKLLPQVKSYMVKKAADAAAAEVGEGGLHSRATIENLLQDDVTTNLDIEREHIRANPPQQGRGR